MNKPGIAVLHELHSLLVVLDLVSCDSLQILVQEGLVSVVILDLVESPGCLCGDGTTLQIFQTQL